MTKAPSAPRNQRPNHSLKTLNYRVESAAPKAISQMRLHLDGNIFLKESAGPKPAFKYLSMSLPSQSSHGWRRCAWLPWYSSTVHGLIHGGEGGEEGGWWGLGMRPWIPWRLLGREDWGNRGLDALFLGWDDKLSEGGMNRIEVLRWADDTHMGDKFMGKVLGDERVIDTMRESL